MFAFCSMLKTSCWHDPCDKEDSFALLHTHQNRSLENKQWKRVCDQSRLGNEPPTFRFVDVCSYQQHPATTEGMFRWSAAYKCDWTSVKDRWDTLMSRWSWDKSTHQFTSPSLDGGTTENSIKHLLSCIVFIYKGSWKGQLWRNRFTVGTQS